MDQGINGLASKIARSKNLDPQHVERYTKITAYNIRQVAFNAVTIAALAVVIFAGIALLPLGPALLLGGILFMAHLLVRESIDQSFADADGMVEEYMISNHIKQPLPQDWNAVALRIFDIPLWRNTISMDFPTPPKNAVEDSKPELRKNERDSDDDIGLSDRRFAYSRDSRQDHGSVSFGSSPLSPFSVHMEKETYAE